MTLGVVELLGLGGINWQLKVKLMLHNRRQIEWGCWRQAWHVEGVTVPNSSVTIIWVGSKTLGYALLGFSGSYLPLVPAKFMKMQT